MCWVVWSTQGSMVLWGMYRNAEEECTEWQETIRRRAKWTKRFLGPTLISLIVSPSCLFSGWSSTLFLRRVYDNVPFLPWSTTTFSTYRFSSLLCNLYQSIPALTRSKLVLGYIIIFCFVLINVNFIIPPAFFPLLLFETYRHGSDITSSLGNLPYFLLK